MNNWFHGKFGVQFIGASQNCSSRTTAIRDDRSGLPAIAKLGLAAACALGLAACVTPQERHALGVLDLGEDTDLHRVRKRYSELVRRYHPDRNGGDRSHEAKLMQVIEAWQVLHGAQAFA